MIRKRLKKRLKKSQTVKDLVQSGDTIAQKASELKNPLAENPGGPVLSEDVPQITNETIAEHREEVLKGARKYIYPLQHSKKRILVITSVILTASLTAFLIYCGIGLYKLYQHNTFLYRVTQVVPFPIARVGNDYVEYENYLFELRHYIHYYQNQLDSNFDGSDREQLLEYRKQALQDVINYAYVKKLAEQNDVSVSGREVDERINIVREQNRLGSNDKVLSDVLRDYWGWSISDFKRSLKQRILTEKVVAKLDTETRAEAEDTLIKLKSGADFGELAKQVSDDSQAKTNEGEFGAIITRSNPNIPPAVIEALFKLQPGQVSDIINTGSTLEIVKVEESDGTGVTARHISFNLKDIFTFIKPLSDKEPSKAYVSL